MAIKTLNIGDRVLFVKSYGAAFEPAVVTKVTKKWAYIATDSSDDYDHTKIPAFTREFRGSDTSPAQKCRYYASAAVRLDTPENRAALTECHLEVEKRAAEKRADAERREAAYEERLAAEFAAVRAAMGMPTGMPMTRTRDTMPDGSRLYNIDIPVHPEYTERKKGWERLIIRCVESSCGLFGSDDKNVIESGFTYCNGSSHSFSSVSTSRYETDEDAIWDAIRRQYHSWS